MPQLQGAFRVTAATLARRARQGACGRCGHQFDVLESPVRRTAGEPATAALTETQRIVSRLRAGLSVLTTGRWPRRRRSWRVADGRADDASQKRHPEDYHFSAEDIEKVFIDARDWQSSTAARRRLPSDARSPTRRWSRELEVDEPERVEDITLEGVKVDIASETGESVTPRGGVRLPRDEDSDDLDSTSRLRMLEDVPGLGLLRTPRRRSSGRRIACRSTAAATHAGPLERHPHHAPAARPGRSSRWPLRRPAPTPASR